MKTVTTVAGEIRPESLGPCQSHEHLCIMRGRSSEINPDLLIDDEERSATELRAYHAAGGRAVVDAQPVGCGRDAGFLQNISRASGVHIIASTGFHKLSFYPEDHWIFSTEEDELAEIFASELTEGMFADCGSSSPRTRTDARAGQIKTALDSCEIDSRHEKFFSAAAAASKRTGRTLMAHIERGADPVGLADFLRARGVDLGRVIFCHMDRAVSDLTVHKKICAMGIFLEYDTICRPKYHDDGREAEIIGAMLDSGLEDSILLGLDTTRARLESYGGSPGLSYIHLKFKAFLKERGVSDGQLRKMLEDNPARAFSHGGL